MNTIIYYLEITNIAQDGEIIPSFLYFGSEDEWRLASEYMDCIIAAEEDVYIAEENLRARPYSEEREIALNEAVEFAEELINEGRDLSVGVNEYYSQFDPLVLSDQYNNPFHEMYIGIESNINTDTDTDTTTDSGIDSNIDSEDLDSNSESTIIGDSYNDDYNNNNINIIDI